MYDKGIETKDLIYRTAKKLFFEYGYQKTTVRFIAQHANVPLGLISYHFKNKDNIIQKIYNDYIESIFELIDAETEENIKSYLLRQVIGLRIYYNNILGVEKISNFNYELIQKQTNFNILFNRIEKSYHGMLDEFGIFIPKEEYNSYIIAEFGARRELLLQYYSGGLHCSIQELVDIIACIAPRLFQIDYDTINSILYKSMSIYKSIGATKINKIKFLV